MTTVLIISLCKQYHIKACITDKNGCINAFKIYMLILWLLATYISLKNNHNSSYKGIDDSLQIIFELTK